VPLKLLLTGFAFLQTENTPLTCRQKICCHAVELAVTDATEVIPPKLGIISTALGFQLAVFTKELAANLTPFHHVFIIRMPLTDQTVKTNP